MSTTTTKNLIEFLLECIADDEAVAKAAIDPKEFKSSPDGRWLFVDVPYEGEWPINADDEHSLWSGADLSDSDWALHATRFDPARILAECAAKRQVIEKLRELDDIEDVPGWDHCDLALVQGDEMGLSNALRALAAVYKDHEDYDESWVL